MVIEWSGLSPELLVRLDRSASQPVGCVVPMALDPGHAEADEAAAGAV